MEKIKTKTSFIFAIFLFSWSFSWAETSRLYDLGLSDGVTTVQQDDCPTFPHGSNGRASTAHVMCRGARREIDSFFQACLSSGQNPNLCRRQREIEICRMGCRFFGVD